MASDNPLPSVVDDPVVTTSSTISLVDEPKTIKHKLRRIGKFRCMAVVAAVLFVLCVTFLVLYIVKKPKAPEKICDTMTCVYISEDLDKKIDRSVDPCDDFYAYACGGFTKSHRLSMNQSSATAFGEANNNILNVLKGALENVSVNYPKSTSLTKTSQIYDSCIDTPAIETRGITPLQNLIRRYGGWRVTGNGLNSWSVEEKMGQVLKDLNVKTMLSIQVITDLQDSSKHILQILGSSLGMGTDFFTTDSAESQKIREAYKTYMKTVAGLLGGGVHAESQMLAIYDFEEQLAKATQDDFVSDDLIESLKAHHRSGRSLDSLDNTLDDFALDSFFDLSFILGFLNTAFQNQGFTFNGNEKALYFNADTYFHRLNDVYTQYKRDQYAIVKDYIMWRVVDAYVSSMPSAFVEAKLKYVQTIRGVQPFSRSSYCIMGIMKPLGMTLARLYVDTSFDESSKSTVTDMTKRIRQAFVDNLKSAKWMDSSTREKAKDKALAIKDDVGYPSYIKDTAKLDAEYSTLPASSNFFENSMALNSYLVQNNLGLLKQPVDKSRWLESPAQVNAYYSPQQNRIVILAGILQDPFYTKNYPKYMDYGAIGTVVGHEITHGFDGSGRLFDKNGNLQNWWSLSSSLKFESKKQCLIDQYNKYKVFGRNIKGNQTINENIADNGGIKIAYDAYQAWVKDNAAEGRLPGLGLSVDQLFFVGFGQLWCSVYKQQAAYYQLNVDVHSFPKYRVIGTLSNFDKFATAFSCPSGSVMNPTSKCSIW